MADAIKIAEEVLGTKQTAADLVAYGKGAVVSKAVLARETGTVTLFAFDKGEGLSTHQAPYDALVYVLEGKAAVTIEEQTQEVGAGEMIILPANKPHALDATEAFKMMLVMIREAK